MLPQPVPPASSLLADSFTPRLHYILTGTFNTLFLYLLAFSPYSPNGPTLTVHRRVRGEGPHQFVALNEERDRAYVTTWAQPPSLSSWEVLEGGRGGVRKINTVPICALALAFQQPRSLESLPPLPSLANSRDRFLPYRLPLVPPLPYPGLPSRRSRRPNLLPLPLLTWVRHPTPGSDLPRRRREGALG